MRQRIVYTAVCIPSCVPSPSGDTRIIQRAARTEALVRLILGMDREHAITGYGLVEQIDELRLVDAGYSDPGRHAAARTLLTIHKQLSNDQLPSSPTPYRGRRTVFSKRARPRRRWPYPRRRTPDPPPRRIPIFHYKPSK